MRGLLASVSKKEYLRYIAYTAESCLGKMRLLRQNTGRIVTQIVMIVDMEHLSLRQFTDRLGIQVYYRMMDSWSCCILLHCSVYSIYSVLVMEIGIEATKQSEAHYPECVRGKNQRPHCFLVLVPKSSENFFFGAFATAVYVINVPTIFAVVFSMIKSLLHEATVNKFRVFDGNADKWKAALLEEIDADQLPVYYGGTQRDPDGNPMCLTKVTKIHQKKHNEIPTGTELFMQFSQTLCLFFLQVVSGGPVPKSYYLKKSKPQAKDDMQCATVSRGSKKKVELDVSLANTTLE